MQSAARHLRDGAPKTSLTPDSILGAFEQWAAALDSTEVREIPGVTFLRLWLRRGTLEPILIRELGPHSLQGGWHDEGRVRMRAFPLGVIGHWPAGNIEIQPLLSMTCALLGGNSCLVRVPTALVGITRIAMVKLAEADDNEILMPRIFMASFHHSRRVIHEAMARAVDGAMIWG